MTEETNRTDNHEEEILQGEIVEEGTNAEPQQSTQELEQWKNDLQAAQEQAQTYFEGWQRERADFANYKRRIERDQQTLSQTITANVIKKYLAVLDDLERALKNRPTEGTAVAWAEGLELIQRKLQTILESEGIKRIEAENAEFDPNRHEAVSYEEHSDFESGHVIEVLQQGYTLGERVIRPAVVRIAR